MKSITRNLLLAGCCLSMLVLQTNAYFESEQIEQKYESAEDSEPMQALSNVQSQQIQQQQTSSSLLDQQTTSSVANLVNEVVQVQPTQSVLSQSDQTRLNEIYNRLASAAQAMPKPYQDDSQISAASTYSSLSQVSAAPQAQEEARASSSNDYGTYQSMSGGSEGLSKITQIPQGSMFAFPDKNGKLEFESMYAKQPYSIVFRTQSMPVKIKQQHQTLPAPEVEFVRSQEEAHRIKHEVIRPVIQEVHEIIQPYRRVVQEVRPVIENVHTIVAKGEARGGAGGAAGAGLSGGAGGLNGGAGGGYADNIRGSYSENRIRYMAMPEQQQMQPQMQRYHHLQQSQRSFRANSELRPTKSQRYLSRRY